MSCVVYEVLAEEPLDLAAPDLVNGLERYVVLHPDHLLHRVVVHPSSSRDLYSKTEKLDSKTLIFMLFRYNKLKGHRFHSFKIKVF